MPALDEFKAVNLVYGTWYYQINYKILDFRGLIGCGSLYQATALFLRALH